MRIRTSDLTLPNEEKWNAVPPNKGMELTVKSDTPFAREEQRARRFCLELIPGDGLLSNRMENKKVAIDHFAEVARRYCAWAEDELGDPDEEMRRVRLLLAELHLAAVKLPALGIGKKIDAVSISHDEWSRFYEKFRVLPVTEYLDVFNPLKADEPVTSNLADDLADIYRDVKAGLSLHDAQHPVDAAWEWRLNFQVHWGQHLVGAQRAIHEYLSDEGL